jgi:hypothetical protein
LNVEIPQVSSFSSSARMFQTRVVRMKKDRRWVVVLHLGMMNLVAVLLCTYRDSISDDGQLGIGLTRWRPCNIKACVLGFCVIS